MTKEEVIQRLKKEPNRAQLARDLELKRKRGQPKINYLYISRLVYDEIKDPGSARIDRLREYYTSLDQ